MIVIVISLIDTIITISNNITISISVIAIVISLIDNNITISNNSYTYC